jgi:hypothetical protein
LTRQANDISLKYAGKASSPTWEINMQADEGNRVTIRFICRYEDGTIYEFADRDTLDFVIGEGNTLPSLEKGVIGMAPGDLQTIVVSAAELVDYPFYLEEAPTDAGFPAGIAGSGSGDDYSPDEDPALPEPDDLQIKPLKETPSVSSDLYFDVEMLAVEDAEVELEE